MARLPGTGAPRSAAGTARCQRPSAGARTAKAGRSNIEDMHEVGRPPRRSKAAALGAPIAGFDVDVFKAMVVRMGSLRLGPSGERVLESG